MDKSLLPRKLLSRKPSYRKKPVVVKVKVPAS
jgi:hypothetical protein